MTHPPPPVDWDLAAADVRAAWLNHVSSCTDCRATWTAGDASRIFTLLADFPAGGEAGEQEVLDRLSAGIRKHIRTDRPTGRWYSLAAAALLVAALLAPSAAWLFRDRPAVPLRTAAYPLADVEVLSTPGEAQIIDLSVGDTQVVMIFDSRLEI